MTLLEKARQNRLSALNVVRSEVTNIFADAAERSRHTRPVLTLLTGGRTQVVQHDFDPDLGLRLAA